jgi:hypothetical protein
VLKYEPCNIKKTQRTVKNYMRSANQSLICFFPIACLLYAPRVNCMEMKIVHLDKGPDVCSQSKTDATCMHSICIYHNCNVNKCTMVHTSSQDASKSHSYILLCKIYMKETTENREYFINMN